MPLSTNAFINTLSRFIVQRAQIMVFSSNNATIVVGGERELRRAIAQWNNAQISFVVKRHLLAVQQHACSLSP